MENLNLEKIQSNILEFLIFHQNMKIFDRKNISVDLFENTFLKQEGISVFNEFTVDSLNNKITNFYEMPQNDMQRSRSFTFADKFSKSNDKNRKIYDIPQISPNLRRGKTPDFEKKYDYQFEEVKKKTNEFGVQTDFNYVQQTEKETAKKSSIAHTPRRKTQSFFNFSKNKQPNAKNSNLNQNVKVKVVKN